MDRRLLALAGWFVASAAVADVAVDQRDVVQRFQRLEANALRVADDLAETQPDRAEQIREALSQARAEAIGERFDRVVTLLERQRLSAARADQDRLAEQLERLLRAVMEDPDQKRLAEERARIERLRKELRVAVRKQRDLRRGRDRASGSEGADAQESLADDVAESRDAAFPQSDQDGAQSEAQSPTDQALEQAESAMRAAAEKLAQQGSKKHGQQGGEQQQGKPGEGDGGEQPESAEDDQREAQRRLEEALRRVEERLRQLREDEQQRRLAQLAERFDRLRRDQLVVIEQTEPLVTDAAESLTDTRQARVVRQAAARVAEREEAVAQGAEQAGRLVRADGASLAFAEAIDQLTADLRSAEARLRDGRADALTLGLERAALDAIEQLAEAVEQSRQELQKKQESSQQQGGGGGGDPQLVSRLAELRLLRSTQAGILRRTELWSEAPAASAREAADQLRELAERQRRLASATDYAAKRAAGGR